MYRSSCVVYFLDARPGGIAASSPGRRPLLAGGRRTSELGGGQC
jgi:hypothetical protein